MIGFYYFVPQYVVLRALEVSVNEFAKIMIIKYFRESFNCAFQRKIIQKKTEFWELIKKDGVLTTGTASAASGSTSQSHTLQICTIIQQQSQIY